MSEVSKPGEFCWNELMTRDDEAATKFYTELLGWSSKTEDMGSGQYTVFSAGEKMVGGMMAMDESFGDLHPHWMSYITVEDVDESVKQVEALGGKVCHPPTDIPNVGRFSVITDPTGAAISLITFPKK